MTNLLHFESFYSRQGLTVLFRLASNSISSCLKIVHSLELSLSQDHSPHLLPFSARVILGLQQ